MFAYDGVELIEGKNVGTGNGIDDGVGLDVGLCIGMSNGPGLAWGLGVGAGMASIGEGASKLHGVARQAKQRHVCVGWRGTDRETKYPGGQWD